MYCIFHQSESRIQLDSEAYRAQTKKMNKHVHSVCFVCVLLASGLLAEYKIQLGLRRVPRHGQTTRTSDPAVRWEEDVNRTHKAAGNRGYLRGGSK